MIEKKFLEKLKKDYKKNEVERRKIISISNDILFRSKKVIFALQKSDTAGAKKSLAEIEKILISIEKDFGFTRLIKEGAYKAAVEEYLEGKTFSQILENKKIDINKKIHLDYEAYLGGICDMIGELVRYSTNKAAEGKFSIVAKTKKTAEVLMEDLADFDMTGYLRTKYDQARGHLRKLEQMAYEIKLRGKK